MTTTHRPATGDGGHQPLTSAPRHGMHWPVLEGVLPIDPGSMPGNILAGVTLAALGIPEVLGYAKIAGMPVVSGLYTILLPMAVFALLGSSRHLVVGADSATAAILAAGLAGTAAAGSHHYVALAGLAALVTAALLLVARLIRLGFLANFLSRTVLIGFLTGVGVQVAVGQLAEMLGVHASGHGTVHTFLDTVRAVPHISLATLAVSLAVIVVALGVGRITRRVPSALIAVVGAIVVSKAVDLPAHGVHVLGKVPQGVPHLALPALSISEAVALLGTSVSLFVVILAQSSATSRAYAAKYEEDFSEDSDLVGLAGANLAAAVTGTFVVNGSPTKTEMVDGAGGRSQLAQLTTSVVVLLVLLFLTGPLAALPLAVLATIVFLIGVELVDVGGMRHILAVRRDEFVVALLTALAVIFIGVEQGIIFAIVASIVDHLRHSYSPRNVVLVPAGPAHWHSVPATPGQRSVGDLLIYRFGASLYYANAHQLLGDVTAFVQDARPLSTLALDFTAIGDVDFTAAAVLRRAHSLLHSHGIPLVFVDVPDPVRRELDRYGITDLVGAGNYFPALVDLLHEQQPSAAGAPHGTATASRRAAVDGSEPPPAHTLGTRDPEAPLKGEDHAKP